MEITDYLILGAIANALIPLGFSLFFYITVPTERHGRRRPSTVFTQFAIGRAFAFQKIALFLLFTYIIFARIFGDFPGRDIVAWTLYASLVVAFWQVFFVQRAVQKTAEESERRNRDATPKENHQ